MTTVLKQRWSVVLLTTLFIVSFSTLYCISSYRNAFRSKVEIAFVTSYFRPEDAQRSGEINVCLASLVSNFFIKKVHVLVEAKDLPLPSFASHHPKTKEVLIASRPLMGDFIQYSCDHLMDHRVIFANADIFYDSTLEYFATISDEDFDATFFAVSRWWFDDGGDDGILGTTLDPKRRKGLTPYPYPQWGSYDTFAFRPRVICEDKAKLKDMVESLNYTLGVLGAENRLLYEVKRQYPEMRFENPYKNVVAIHIHQSTFRSAAWAGRVDLDGKSVVI
ncbi:putative ATP-dependent RNA helicase ddx49 [Linnemannia exigua]|uniref:ATP-dependent RNA helicase ddx49 n=1 Tax=Linnemannia exigua TaxID=604196 RepID=A0AAD4D5S5_9FUNG|nr:putative ATP-dependent RNA helicase ddx49 [Linnemannia exigua]